MTDWITNGSYVMGFALTAGIYSNRRRRNPPPMPARPERVPRDRYGLPLVPEEPRGLLRSQRARHCDGHGPHLWTPSDAMIEWGCVWCGTRRDGGPPRGGVVVEPIKVKPIVIRASDLGQSALADGRRFNEALARLPLQHPDRMVEVVMDVPVRTRVPIRIPEGVHVRSPGSGQTFLTL